MHRVAAIGTLGALLACRGPEAAPAYRDPARPVEERVRDLLGRMTLEEKFWQLFMVPGDLSDGEQKYGHGIFGLQLLQREGNHDPRSTAARAAERANAVQRFLVEHTRLGIPAILFEEAAHGLVQDGATSYPQAIALAATWDTALVARVAAGIAREARARGVRQVLAPVLNLGRDPRWGRVEETFGEDPHLASAMAVAFVAPFEHAGIITTPKHFVANYGDGGRDSYPVSLDQAELVRTYLPPFRAALEAAGARSVMAAYNSVGGIPATANAGLLRTLLKEQWGFRGFVISDAAAVGGANVLHFTSPDYATSTKQAIEAGLDVIFQSSVDQAPLFKKAFDEGRVDRQAIDRAVGRVLRAKFELGLFEHPYVDSTAAAAESADPVHGTDARLAAREAIALLKNQGGTLPLHRSVRTIAVIGTDAEEARLGGYSGAGVQPVSILDALREKLGAARVRYAPGPGRMTVTLTRVAAAAFSHDSAEMRRPGLRGEYFNNLTVEGSPRTTRTDSIVDFSWTLGRPGAGINRDWYSARWSGTVTASRRARIGVTGNDGYRLWLDGKVVIENWEKRSFGTRLAPVPLAPGHPYDLRLEYFETTGNGHIRLVWDQGIADTAGQRIAEAVRLARASDVAVIVAGLEEGEFRDRARLGLPGRQAELIQAVVATGRPVVVVLIGGSAVTMDPWLDRVSAVLMAWYPGEQGGRAVADVLFGDANPAGRLPLTFPLSEGQLPLVYDHLPTGRGDDYLDLTGQPLFPFGYGLSYSAFEYSGLELQPDTISTGDSAVVRCRVKNLGPYPGDEVVQLYIRDLVASTAQPVQALRGFARIHLAPGAEQVVTFQLGPKELSALDASLHPVVEPGQFRIRVGSSSRDIRLRGTLTVRPPR